MKIKNVEKQFNNPIIFPLLTTSGNSLVVPPFPRIHIHTYYVSKNIKHIRNDDQKY